VAHHLFSSMPHYHAQVRSAVAAPAHGLVCRKGMCMGRQGGQAGAPSIACLGMACAARATSADLLYCSLVSHVLLAQQEATEALKPILGDYKS